MVLEIIKRFTVSRQVKVKLKEIDSNEKALQNRIERIEQATLNGESEWMLSLKKRPCGTTNKQGQ